jgi:hypothetical protein
MAPFFAATDNWCPLNRLEVPGTQQFEPPNTQIQSLSEGEAGKEDKGLSPADQGEVRQNPQCSRNKINFEDDTLP